MKTWVNKKIKINSISFFFPNKIINILFIFFFYILIDNPKVKDLIGKNEVTVNDIELISAEINKLIKDDYI